MRRIANEAGRGLSGAWRGVVACCLGLVTGAAGGEEPKAAAAGADKPAADTVTVERGPFEVVFSAKGTLEPVDSTTVEFRPEAWSQPLEIVRIVPHGARVTAGDPLVQFDTEKLDRGIADLRLELAASEKALEVARRELPAAEALHPLEMADAERQNKVAAEDLARFLAIEKALAERVARFDVRAAEERLKYAREELRQLEQMYKDKDLTEETEEMILQRTRFEVAQAEFALERIAEASEQNLLLGLPRREIEVRRLAETAAIGLEKARATLPLQLEQRRLAVAKQEHDRAQSLRRLEELQRDREAATVKAPRAGMVYYGRLRDGAWTSNAVAAKAVVGQAANAGEIELTVLDPDRLAARVKVEEKDLHLLGPGLAGRLEPTGWPDAEVPVTLGPFAPVPREGSFDAVFTVAAKEGGPRLLPGMTGTVQCVVAKRPEAITLPSGAVFRDDDGGRYVVRVAGDGKPEKRPVKVGATAGGRTEILEGVGAGDRVRASKP